MLVSRWHEHDLNRAGGFWGQYIVDTVLCWQSNVYQASQAIQTHCRLVCCATEEIPQTSAATPQSTTDV